MRITSLLALAATTVGFPLLHAQEQLIPKPVEMEVKDSTPFTIDLDTLIYVGTDDKAALEAAKLIQEMIRKGTGLDLAIIEANHHKQPSNSIALYIGTDAGLKDKGKEAYAVSSSKDGGYVIRANAKEGLFYGFSTLMQLLPVSFHDVTANKSQVQWTVGKKSFEMTDYPRFGWRAFMLDEARHFFGEHAVKQLIDQMALLKMNILHWGLVNDAGWRLEIKKYPMLAEKGGRRTDSEIGTWKSGRYSGKPHAGYYTQEQIKDIVKYAADRNITIVPEINMPGHNGAAAAAYPHLSLKAPKATPTDFITNVALDPTKESTYTFISDVMDEVVALFPSPVIHFGGDEVRYTQQWRATPQSEDPYAPVNVAKFEAKDFEAMPILPEIVDFMKKHNLKNMSEVQMVFSNRVSNIISSKGRRGMGWNEIYGIDVNHDGGGVSSLKLDKEAIIHVWKGDINHAKKAIKDGYTIVNGLHWATYLDYSYGSIPLDKSYSFEPVLDGLTEEEAKSVLGPSTQMWTEWTPTRERMHFQAFPRTLAYAEVGWTQKDKRDFSDFTDRFTHYEPILDASGIAYNKNARVPFSRSEYEKSPKLGNWNVKGADMSTLKLDATAAVKMRGDYRVGLFFDGGADGAAIKTVRLLEDGKLIATDTHDAFSGNDKRDIIYKLNLPAYKAGAKYSVEVELKADRGGDSRGTIFMKAPESL